MEKQVCSIIHQAYARQNGEFFVKKARAVFHPWGTTRSLMRLRQFTSFNPLLIPWNQITLPFPPPLLQIPYPFCQLVNRLSVLVKGEKKPLNFFRSHFLQPESLFTGYPFVACHAGQTNCRFPCSSVSKRGWSLVSK